MYKSKLFWKIELWEPVNIIFTDYLKRNGDEVKLNIDKSVGGGKGIFVEFASSGKFVILNVKGVNTSYHISDIGYKK